MRLFGRGREAFVDSRVQALINQVIRPWVVVFLVQVLRKYMKIESWDP